MPLYLDYYYGNEAEQYNFYRIPKLLFTDERFKGVSVEAKVLYGLMLDRMSLSVKNKWLDEFGRVYIVFTVNEVMEMIGCAEQKATRLLNELDDVKGVGLIERKRRGLGKPNIIYVKNFLDKTNPDTEGNAAKTPQSACQKMQISSGSSENRNTENEKIKTLEFPISPLKNNEYHNSEAANIAVKEPLKSQCNNTYINKTDFNKTYLSSIHHDNQKTDREDNARGIDLIYDMYLYKNIIKMNIDYDILVEDQPLDKDRIDGFVELMTEICCKEGTVRVNHEDMPAAVVKKRFLELNGEHIRYVLECLDKNTSLIGNIRAYIISALFNAPVTMSQYYQSLANHDIAKMS